MNRQSFATLLNKYLTGNCTPSEQKVVEEWYELLEEIPDSDWNTRELEEKLWQRISLHSKPNQKVVAVEKPAIRFWKNTYFRVGIAASILLLISVLSWPYFQKKVDKAEVSVKHSSVKGMVDMENSSNHPIKVMLEDGSQVTLNPHSKLSYPEKFIDDKREVYLTGEGFFEVQKNPAKPFFVYTGNVTTRVLGTSFYVKSFDGVKKVEVEVVTGRVSVYEKHTTKTDENKQSNGVVLTPNHKVTFFAESNVFVTNIVKNPIIQLGKIQDTKVFFEFDDTPIVNVLQKLREAYGIDILIEDEGLNNCFLTADITHQPLYTKLDIICAAVGATYEVKGTTILISGKGCE